MSEEYLSVSRIKQTYGLTLSALKLIGEPDKLVVNPIYKCAVPMKMYSTARIEAFLQTDEYKVWKEKNIKRTNAAEKAIETKQAKLEEQWDYMKKEALNRYKELR